ncbi:MAG: site-specific integrase [Pseudomonadota bacterium]|nr:site-specific integrase [Pseudomonadota bacterium]
MDYIEKKQLIQKCFKDMLEADRADMHKGGLLSSEEVIQSEQLALRIEKGQAHLLASNVIQDIKKEAGLEGCNDSDVYDEILKGLAHYNKERVRLNEELSDPAYTVSNLMSVNTSHASPISQRGLISLSDAVDRYFKENSNVWTPSTQRDYQTYVRYLYKTLGESVAVGSLSYEQVDLVRDALDAENKAIPTKQKYVSFYRSFFAWCKGQRYCKEPLFDSVKFKGNTGSREVRGFEKDELLSLYTSLQQYRAACAESKRNKIHNYWITMILMFSGARLNEIAQLYVENIHEEDGIRYIEISDRFENQSIKTDSSRRHVPIHLHLVGLGFLEYVESIRQEGSERLFPELNYQPNRGTYAKNVSRWFNDNKNGFLTKLGLKSKHVDMHSLRRTFISVLERADEKEALIASVVGHGKKTITQRYNDGYTLEQKLRAISLFKEPQ